MIKHPLIVALCLLFLYSFSPVQAIEPGTLTPRKPGYQLPLIPQWQNDDTDPKDLNIKTPKEKSLQQTIGIQFILKAIQFEGNKSLGDKDLQAVIQPFINKTTNRIGLEHIRQQLIQYYRQAGYLYPSIILPSQHIKQGLVRYQINEGHLTDINIKGAGLLDNDYIRNRIKLDSNQPLKQSTLLKHFQLLLTDPLIERVNGALKPGPHPGDTILDLDITRAQPYELYLGMDNYTPPSVGSYTGHLSGTVRNLTGQGDFLQIDLNGSEGMQSINSFFSLPFNRYNSRFNIGIQASQSKVIDNALEQLKIKNEFINVNVGINQPILRSLNRIFNLELQYDFKQAKTSIFDASPFPLVEGVETNGKATISSLRFIQNFLNRNHQHVFTMRSSFNVGFDAFSATINPSPIPDGRYFSWQGQLRYLYKLDERGTELFFRTDLQFVSTPLLPLERFALGGKHTIRGYRQYEIVRDEGYALSIELRYPLWLQKIKKGHQLRVIPFFDFGQAWNKHQDTNTLYSAGVGLKWQWQQLSAEFYWAKALKNLVNITQEYDVQDSGIHFQIQLQIL
ncbi:MAG: ShlB/FhaC/HecB family hemolysin secretion/activation protein [Methylococcales bacterium]|nr:ShlB/FhaC/HecB family hemolysin secretion/activation protein [Methylococcales bacterium]